MNNPSIFHKLLTIDRNMEWWEGIILGLVQGLTEFLPVSSSGHLVISEELLGTSGDYGGTTFEVFVHFGTVMSIVVVYFQYLSRVIREGIIGAIKPAGWKENYRNMEGFRMAVHILLTMLPTGIVYILFKDFIEEAFTSARFASGMLLVTGVLLFLTMIRRSDSGSMNWWKALLVGTAQSMAMMPGISRSGSTIATALYLGTKREEATRFSFLMSVPVIVAATLIGLIEIVKDEIAIDWIPLLLGMLTAFISGIIAIKTVMVVVQKGRLHFFAIYCFLVGVLGLLFFK